MTSAIPPDLRVSIERQTGCEIIAERPRGGGGASRQGAEITLRDGAGHERGCYLAWDERARDPARRPFFERETAILKALSGPLRDAGVPVAPLLASEPAHLALCSAFVEGEDRFPAASDKPALARDFLGHLARLHAVDAADPALAALGDPREPPSTIIRNRLAELRAENLANVADPILQLAIEWLIGNVPPDRGPAVVLHGDAGPGNFLYRDNKVTALVDWELTHLGDPMEDLAQIWVRSLIQPFVPMREAFAAYEAASGTPVDVTRVKYHRLYFQIGFSVKGGAGLPPTGMGMMFGTMHRRIIVESLAELSGVPLRSVALPEVEASPAERGFDAVLADLKDVIVPALADERASAKAKGMARMVKYWRMRDRYGSIFDSQEMAELAGILGSDSGSLHEARTALGHRIAAGTVPFTAALELCHARVTRETALMADAMGALATTCYEDIR